MNKIEKDLIAGRMIRTTYVAAKRIYGEKFLIGALGLIEEGPEKFRLIHDGTHLILMNNRVRVLDQVSSPMVNDLTAELSEIEEERKKRLGLRRCAPPNPRRRRGLGSPSLHRRSPGIRSS